MIRWIASWPTPIFVAVVTSLFLVPTALLMAVHSAKADRARVAEYTLMLS